MARRVPHTKKRRLWLNLKVRTGQRNVTRADVLSTLINSIERGDYEYPSDWYVQIEWRNRENVNNRVGEFTAEMHLSKRSSDGFDKAVLNYLRSK